MNISSRLPLVFVSLSLLLTACTGPRQNPWDAPVVSQAAATAPKPIASVAPSKAAQPAAPSAKDLPPTKVGILLPLSGKNAELGQAMLQSAQLALFDMGYTNFELVPQDTRGTPDGAQAAADTAIREGAQLLLGPVFSPEVRVVKTIAARKNINVVAFTTDWTQAGGNTFVMGFLPFSQVERVARYAAAKGYKRVGILAPENDYGNTIVGSFNAAASKIGMNQPVVVKLPADESGIQNAVAAFVPNGVPVIDAVMIPVAGDNANRLAAALTAAGMGPDKVRRLGTGLWDEGGVTASANLRGGWFAAPQPDARRGYETKYRSLYMNTPPRLASLAYDATALAAVLARNGLATSGKPAFDRQSLLNPNGFAGVDGIFRFQSNGMVDRGLAVLELNGKSATVTDPAPKTFQRAAF